VDYSDIFSGTVFASISKNDKTEVEWDEKSELDGNYDLEKPSFAFSRSKSASTEALYRRDMTSLLNFHDLSDETEMLEWDEDSETPEFSTQRLIMMTSQMAMPKLEAGTQTNVGVGP
jgi:hypothetical protein